MKIAVFQMKVEPGLVDSNYQKVKSWAEQIVKTERPDLLVLPELWNTSYVYDRLTELADKDCIRTKEVLGGIAARLKVNIVGGSISNIRQGDSRAFNTSLVFNRSGELVYSYDKVHPATTMGEEKYFAPGIKAPELFELDKVKMGLAICYDLRFPEIARPIAVQGAEVIIFMAAWPLKRIDHWTSLLKARAIENEAFIVGCSRVGDCEGSPIIPLGGKSAIFDPFGKCIALGDENSETTVIADIDLNVVKEMRNLVPVLQDRHPEIYCRN